MRRGMKLLHEDAQLVAFADARPRARHHLLVVPRAHVGHDPGALRGAEDTAMLRRMVRVGHELLDQLQDPGSEAGQQSGERVLGFHLPPFNSVHHLHLHCLGLPFTPWWQRARFVPHFGTFATADAVLRRIEGAP